MSLQQLFRCAVSLKFGGRATSATKIGYDLLDSPPHDLLSHPSKQVFWFDIPAACFVGATLVTNTGNRQERPFIPVLTNSFFLSQRKP